MSSIAAIRVTELQSRIARFDDQQAYKELYSAFYSPLFQFVNQLVHSREAAEEIISDVFMKIWERRSELETISNLRVYCFVAAKNLSLNHMEARRRMATLPIEDQSEIAFHGDPEQIMITGEMMKRIRTAIDGLPYRCRLVFQLVKENGFRYRETAEILHCSVKTVENQLAIALRKLSASIHFDVVRSVPLGVGHDS
jgi:RNA polymerase sigma-70 factor (family 1)